MSQTDTRPYPNSPRPHDAGSHRAGPHDATSYGVGRPGHDAPRGVFGQPYAGPPPNPWAAPPSGPPSSPDQRPAGRDRGRPGWVGVVGASVLAAALASGATFAGVQALDDSPAPVAAASSTPDAPVQTGDGTSPDWTAVAAAVAPSVVTIQVSSEAGSGQGSGVVLDAEGNILTNNHVVSGAGEGADINVILADGRVFSDVEVVGLDPTTDLAVLRLTDPPQDLEPATLGSSADVVPGQEVMAVGNPLGLSDTVTTGIVSAINRPVTTQEQPEQAPQSPFGGQGQSQAQGEPVVTNAIQTDAAINPGNSGGALVDTSGAVIGVNSSIASTSAEAGSIGIGFAIPVDEAQRIAGELIDDGSADHALLGVSLQDGMASTDGATRQGAEVAEVVPGSAADQAGLQTGDTVVALDGDDVTGAESLTAQVRERAPGTEVTLSVVRSGESLNVPVVLGTRTD